MPKERTHRQARAVLEQGKHSWIWVVEACPYCGKAHAHYGGPLDGDPHRYLNWHAPAYCNKADRRRWKHRHPILTFNYKLTTDQLPAHPYSHPQAEPTIPPYRPPHTPTSRSAEDT